MAIELVDALALTAVASRGALDLESAALEPASAFATSAEGDLAETAVQPGTPLVEAIEAIVPTLPTTLPITSGKLWNNGGLLCIS